MLIFKLRHSYHYKKLWAWRIPWNPESIAQVSHEPLMTASFPKCRKRTDQSGIVMRFSGAVYYKTKKPQNPKTNKKIQPSKKYNQGDFQWFNLIIIYRRTLPVRMPLVNKFIRLSFFCPLPPSVYLVLMHQDPDSKWHRGLHCTMKSG